MIKRVLCNLERNTSSYTLSSATTATIFFHCNDISLFVAYTLRNNVFWKTMSKAISVRMGHIACHARKMMTKTILCYDDHSDTMCLCSSLSFTLTLEERERSVNYFYSFHCHPLRSNTIVTAFFYGCLSQGRDPCERILVVTNQRSIRNWVQVFTLTNLSSSHLTIVRSP
jgi:hypothetical protein